MPSNPDSQFAFRDCGLARYYNKNHGNSPTPLGARSQALKRDIGRYQYLIEMTLPKFSEKEAIAIWSAINGCNTSHIEALESLQQGVVTELEQPLNARIKALSLAEWIAVIDACDRVGGGEYCIENLTEELKRVGMI